MKRQKDIEALCWEALAQEPWPATVAQAKRDTVDEAQAPLREIRARVLDTQRAYERGYLAALEAGQRPRRPRSPYSTDWLWARTKLAQLATTTEALLAAAPGTETAAQAELVLATVREWLQDHPVGQTPHQRPRRRLKLAMPAAS